MINPDSFVRKIIEQQVSEGELVTLRVTGKSMRPFISGQRDDSVIVSKNQYGELNLGVIVFFLHNNRYVFHRIVSVINHELIVQGDGNCVEVEKVKPEKVLGIVRFVVRTGGKKTSPYSFSALVYWRIWYILRPLRKYLLFIYNQLQNEN